MTPEAQLAVATNGREPDAKSRRKVVILRNRIVETHALGAFAAKSCGNPLKEGRLYTFNHFFSIGFVILS